MDVRKLLIMLSAVFLLANCDQGAPRAPKGAFVKTGAPGCSDQNYKGEYLVHWKSGKITVEHFPDDETFIEDFILTHEDEILTSEPHYKIQVEQKVAVSQSGWGGYTNWGVDVIGASALWGDVDPDSQVIVAVIDSGVDIHHPELAPVIYVNEKEEINGLDDDGNGFVDDRHGYDFVVDSGEVRDYTGHGTHVAGVIGAAHDVGEIKGVANQVKILPLAFISNNGGGSVQAAINSIRYAADKKAQVINASWGGSTCSTLLKSEIEALGKQNILFIAAAGNSGSNISEVPEYPAAFEISNMITVGASALGEGGDSQVMTLFSNYGDLVDLMAPGAAITSTYPAEYDNDETLDGLATINGTSMATPHVAGAAALLWSIKPGASYVDIKRAILEGVEPGPFRVKSRGSLFLPESLRLLAR